MKFNITKHGLKRVKHVKMNYYHYVLAVDYILYLAKNVPLPSLEKISLTTLKRFADKLYKWFTQDFDLFDEMDTDAQDFMKAFIIENGLFFYYAIQFNIFICILVLFTNLNSITITNILEIIVVIPAIIICFFVIILNKIRLEKFIILNKKLYLLALLFSSSKYNLQSDKFSNNCKNI